MSKVKCTKCGEDAVLVNTTNDRKAWVCHKCNKFISYEMEIYSRTVGYLRPIKQMNPGKKQEMKDRRYFKLPKEGDEDEDN